MLKSILVSKWRFACLFAGFACLGMLPAHQALAAGDLLVAPTRVVLDGRRGTEVFLNNIGAEEATYRISLELRRMTPAGTLEDITPENANTIEKSALDIIRFAPKRVTLPPNQPQAIRIGLQDIDGLPDGEYRAHMLFRAIPKVEPVVDDPAPTGLKIQLTPIYGVTIPVIVRKGNLTATAALANPRMASEPQGPMLQFDLSRNGDRSVYGEIQVTKPGVAEPVMIAKGIAVYPELTSRVVSLPVPAEAVAQLHGEVIISYYETPEAGGGLISQVRSVLP